MKCITFIRHAKSSWDEYDLPDFERPLKKRGITDARLMIEHVITKLEPPDAIFVSTAVRASDTFTLINQQLNYSSNIVHYKKELYTFDWYELLMIIRSFNNDLHDVFVIGHNPALTEVINYLSFEKKLLNLQTVAVCRMTLDIDSWQDSRKDCGTITLYHFPKEYRGYS